MLPEAPTLPRPSLAANSVADVTRFFAPSRNLQQAAATIFALSAVLPLLLFLYVVWRFDLIEKTEASLGLLLALAISLLGFSVFKQLVNRVSALVRSVAPARSAEELAAPIFAEASAVSAVGQIAEIGQLAGAFNQLLQDLRASTERLEDIVFKLGTLNEMAELAARIPKIQDLLALVLERTMRTVRASIGSIMLLDGDGRTLRMVAARGLPDDLPPGVTVNVGEGIAGKVAELGEPVLVDDIETDPRFAKANDPRYGGGSFICMPVRVRERLIGVINLATKQYRATSPPKPQPFSSTDLQFLNTLMSHIAYALDNARLLEEAQQAAHRLQEVVRDQQLRLTRAQEQMLQAEKLSALGQLVAGVAHELNNPLTVVLGSLDSLRDQLSDAAREPVELALEETQRARAIVQNLLTFARRQPLERRWVSLGEIIDQVLAVRANDLRLAQIAVEQDISPDLPLLWADGNQLQQVLLNLITNAKQAMEEVDGRRRLRITALAKPGQLRIVVNDTGPGIPADLLGRIFDPFVTTKGTRGTGLGLSISYGIIQEHGGKLSVESAPGEGATFTIELPARLPGPAEGQARPGGPASMLPLVGRQVLLVEDGLPVQRMVKGYLESAGCKTIVAASGEEALEKLTHPVDLIVSDLYLPGMDGLSFCVRARARYPCLKSRFLIITGGVVDDRVRNFLTEEKAKLLQKPFTRQGILEAVRDVLAA
jgi:signal transduction histidine kinase